MQRQHSDLEEAPPGIATGAVDSILDADVLARTSMSSLEKHKISATPENYALWYEYHRGANARLRQTIDALLSNHSTFDELTLQDLHDSFLSSAKEEEAVRTASVCVLVTLQEVIALSEGGQADAQRFGATLTDIASGSLSKNVATLRSTIELLIAESRRMAGRSERLSDRMRDSSTKIQTLERNLETALKDASMDPLTGLANRKSFDQAIRRLAGESMNSGEDLALLMIDIDHFKAVNDNWGHQAGDEVLRHVGTSLERAVRGQDFVARYGGEEFAILLPNSDLRSATSVAENVRRALSQHALPLKATPPMGSVTVSIGASCYEPGDSLAEWIGRSDSALYRAKAEGRNCVRVTECVGLYAD